MSNKKAFLTIEILEARIAPATLDVSNGVFTYTAANGELNTVDFRIDAATGKYRLSDGPSITVTGTQAGTVDTSQANLGTVLISPTAVNSIVINLGDGNDTLNVQGLADPLTYNGGAGSDTFTTNNFSGAVTLDAGGGDISIDAETVSLSASSGTPFTNVSSAVFKTDNFQIGQFGGITASIITIINSTAGREFSLGTENGGRVSLTAAEVSKFNAPFIKIGDANSGQILNDSALDFGSAVVALKTGLGVTQSGAGAITAAKLSVDSVQTVSLTGQNSVGDFGGRVTNNGSSLSFTNNKAVQIASFAGVTGLTTNGGTITLNSAGAATQSIFGDISASNLTLTGAGSFDLTQATNHIGTLSANTTGALSYKDSSSFSVSSITTGNADVALIADSIAINGAINAGTGKVTLAPLSDTPEIRLGAADSAGIFGVTAAEMDLMTAATLQIGANGATNVATVVSAITPAHVSGLEIHAASITATGGASITVPTLTLITRGAISFPGANDVDTLIFASGAPTGDNVFADADGFTLGHPFNVAGTQVTTFDVGTATVTLPGSMSFIVSIEGSAIGTGYDQVVVNGTVNIANATLSLVGGGATAGREYVIINNDGADAVTGTFDGLNEGDSIPGLSIPATITYVGGDGNDVAIITADALDGTPAANGKSITFHDVDGDIVTITTSKGTLTAANLTGVQTGGPNGASMFQKLLLDASFAGANITIIAKPSADGGNGFVNLGYLDATGVDLGNVTIAGDLARLSAGTVGGDAKVPALKSLTVQSLGLLGDSTLATADKGFVGIETHGAITKLSVKGDLRGNVQAKDSDGNILTATIGGSFVGADFLAEGSIGLLKIVGDIRTSSGDMNITASTGAIGALTVDGGIYGLDATQHVIVSAFGSSAAKGPDFAIKNVTVKGSVLFSSFEAGLLGGGNADASIGGISVGGDWVASYALAGVSSGHDGRFGTADDASLPGAVVNVLGSHSTISNFVVKGQAYGTDSDTTDMYGVVAEVIGTAKVGSRTFGFTKTGNDAFFAAPTLDGEGTENPMFDFAIREIGASTPAGTIGGGVNLQISADGKTATFNDVDGDMVTVKRSAGSFASGDFTITPVASGGGLFEQLTIGSFPGNISIAAKSSVTNGGNGFVNLGKLIANNIAFGNVSIAGDLTLVVGGAVLANKPGITSLTVQSVGVLNSIAAGAVNQVSGFIGGLGKLAVKGDVNNASLFTAAAADSIGSATIGGAMLGARLSASASIGSVKIGASMIASSVSSLSGTLGAVDVKGDVIQGGFSAFGQKVAPTKGTDLAIKSVSIGGTIENAVIFAGTNAADANADASIGSIGVGGAWLGTSVLAGVFPGAGAFAGTSSDFKASGTSTTRDTADIFSSIASITIKGQALGSTAASDSFGIVAEQIGSAKIGARAFKFDKGRHSATDVFAIAPTGPGLGTPALPFDFYIREITV